MKSSKILILLASTVIVIFGLFLSYIWLTQQPRAKKRLHQQRHYAALVETIQPKPINTTVHIETFGSVIPYRTQTLSARISSAVEYLSPKLLSGSIVKKGELLLRLDASDYTLAIKERDADVAAAKLTLKTELQNQANAKFEFTLAQAKTDQKQKEYILRYPHVQAARAKLIAAEAALQKAKLDYKRCKIYAPFDAIILNVTTAKGDVVNASKALATLTPTQHFFIKALLSPELVRTISMPYNSKKGAAVTIFTTDKQHKPRIGYVCQLEKTVDTQSKMAALLINVEDPLQLQFKHKTKEKNILLLGEYVHLFIEAKELHNVLKIPSFALHNNNTLWILQKNNHLHLQKTKVLWREGKNFYIPANVCPKNVTLITTILQNPVEGMLLRTIKTKVKP
ncbi:efflux RND transporter periplasmic adaptor subunit [Sulfurimonas sp.]